MAIRCPYCKKKLNSVRAMYGHWAFCPEYKVFVKKNGREARLPFIWVGYPNRKPKKWVDRKAVQKPVGKPNGKKPEVKKS